MSTVQVSVQVRWSDPPCTREYARHQETHACSISLPAMGSDWRTSTPHRPPPLCTQQEIVACSPPVQRPPAARSGLLPFQRSRCHPSPVPALSPRCPSLLPQEDTPSLPHSQHSSPLTPAALFPPPQLAAQRDGTAALSTDCPGPLPWARALFPARPFPAASRHYPVALGLLPLPAGPSPLGAGKGSAIFFLSTVEVRGCAHRVRGEGQRRAGLRAQRCRRSALLSEDLTEGSWRI